MNISDYKNVLVLAPHTDDGELGAGATINKLASSGSHVTYVAFSTAGESVPEGFPPDILKTEVKEATKVLGIHDLIIYNYQVRRLNYSRQEILENLIQLKGMSNFDLVLIPSLKDIHQDHSTIATEAVRAFKNTSIWSYELLWNNLDFRTQCFVQLEENHLNKKIEALENYRSQGSRPYLSPEFIRSLAIARGVQIGVKYAEVFEVVRLIHK
jgi:LmbE family N-acetylglucosaminyl deacetylase